MGMNAMDRPVIDGTHTQPAFEATPGLLDTLKLFVTQRQIRWAQAVVVAINHKFAIELFGRAPFGGIDPQPSPFGQAQIATIATARAQLTHPFAMACPPHLLERGQLGLKFPQDLPPM